MGLQLETSGHENLAEALQYPPEAVFDVNLERLLSIVGRGVIFTLSSLLNRCGHPLELGSLPTTALLRGFRFASGKQPDLTLQLSKATKRNDHSYIRNSDLYWC
jgi:hypothetical protein